MSNREHRTEPISNFFNRPRLEDFTAGKDSRQPVTNTFKDRKLNDYDSNIINEKARWEKEDEKLKPELLIRGKETELGNIKKQMRVAEELDNRHELFSLRIKKQRLENELYELRQQTAKKTAFTGAKNMPVVRKIQKFISKNILAKASKKFEYLSEISDSLEKLSNINKSVDELMTMKLPAGETTQYDKLTEYLFQANKIRSSITKNIGS